MLARKLLSTLLNGRSLTISRRSHRICRISDIYSNKAEGSTTIIQGWVKAIRVQKKNVFFDVSDGSCLERLQVFLPRDVKPEELSWGSAVEVAGELGSTPRGQPELRATSVTVRAPCEPEAGLPLLARHICPVEDLRQHPHLRARSSPAAAVLRVRDAVTRALHDELGAGGYLLVHTPLLTSNDCEGAGEVFRVQPDCEATLKAMAGPGVAPYDAYFGSKTFLSVSGQLHLEAAAQGLSKVYSLGPTFRAENSKSRLHLSEFYMLEAEVAFVEDLETLKDITENLIKNVTRNVLKRCGADISLLRGDNERLDWLEKPFISVTLEEALTILGEGEAGDLSKEQELRLVELTGAPTFVTHWPAASKPFYARACPRQPDKVLAMDLLVPLVGELVGGSVRESCPQLLAGRLPSQSLNWYLQLRSFGGAPTAGFGLGLERYLQLLCHIHNIKDTIPFPRWPHNCPM